MKATIKLVIIAGDLEKTEFMQRADMFEPFKVFAWPNQFNVETECNEVSTLDELVELLILKDVETLTRQGQRIVAIFSPGNPAGAYVDRTVKVISTGSQWVLLDEALRAYNFVELTKHSPLAPLPPLRREET